MKLFVGGLSYRMSDQELQQLFAEHGQVDEAIIATDRETHQSRGFGFVTMPNDAQGRRAIDQLNETMIADTVDELHALAARIGLKRSWFQGDHYDLVPSKRAAALAAGATELPRRPFIEKLRAFREHAQA